MISYRWVALPLLAMVLVSCSSSEPEKKHEGDRIPVFESRSLDLVKDEGVELSLSPVSSLTSWPMSSSGPAHVTGHLDLADNPTRLWASDLDGFEGSNTGSLSQPVADEQRFFAMDAASTAFAVDLKTGKFLWKNSLQPEGNDSVPDGGGLAVVDQTTIVASTGYGELIGLRSDTGDILWRVSLPAPAASAPTIFENNAYIVTKSNQVVSVNLASQVVVWAYSGLQQSAGIAGGASPAVFDQTVVAALSSGEVVAIHKETGRSLWFDTLTEESVLGLSDIVADPVVAYNRVFAAPVGGGSLTAFNFATGTRLWQRPLGLVYTPTLAGNALFVTTSDQRVVALTLKGEIVWHVALPTEDEQTWYAPLIAGSKVIVLSSLGEMRVLNPQTGDTIGTLSLGAEIAASPILLQKTLFIVTKDGRVLAYGS